MISIIKVRSSSIVVVERKRQLPSSSEVTPERSLHGPVFHQKNVKNTRLKIIDMWNALRNYV